MSLTGDIVPLNPEQRDAVNHVGAPLLVLAGPGTGKTRVIIARLLRLLSEGHEPESLLAVTFSVKATQEMRDRLAQWAAEHLPEATARGAARVQISTFHGLGRRLTRRFGDVLGVSPEAALLDHAVAKRLLRRLISELGLFPHLAAEGYQSVLEHHLRFEAACKHNARSPEDAEAFALQWGERLRANEPGLDRDALAAARLEQRDFLDHARLYRAFDRECLRQGLFTFDDDLAYPLRIFRKRPELAAFLRAEHRHVVVDELQDVNPAQLELLRWIAPPAAASAGAAHDGGTDLCAVGDDDQAIYAFRGSDPAAVEAFRAMWPAHRAIKLEENHRSAAEIVATGNAVIAHAGCRALGGKTIRASGGRGNGGENGGESGGGSGRECGGARGRVEAFTVPSDGDHGHLVASLILSDKASRPERRWSDYAVLCRGAGQLEKVGAALMLKGVPIDFRRGAAPRDEPAVQDLFAWLGLLADGRDDASTQRLLVRPSFGVGLEEVRGWREAHAAARRAAREGGREASEGFPGLADWLAANKGDVPEVARFTALLAELRRTAATMPADRAVEHVVRTAHLMGDDSPEVLEPSQRARRARALVDAIRFVRSRQAFLDHPGDIGAYLAYDRDLDDEGRNFRAPGLETEQEDDERPDAVSVITAHRAKGLEWDTVFVVKIGRTEGSFGAGGREEPDRIELPPDFTGRPTPDQADEETRLLYVACTRAKRRLVLTAKKKAAPKPKETSSEDLFVSLTHFHPELGIVVTPMEDALRAIGAQAPSMLEEELAERSASASRRERVRREIVHARQWAFAALHDAAAPGVGAEALRGVEQRLVDAARAVAALSAFHAGGSAGEHLAAISAASPLRARVEELVARSTELGGPQPWPAPSPPLRLSYTQIRAFLACPRCWYLRTVLGLPERGSAEADIGTIAHEALRGFYRRFRDADADATGQGPAGPPSGRDLHALADEAFDRGFPALNPDAEAQRRRLHAQLDTLLEKLHPTTHQVLELEFEVRVPITDTRGATHVLVAKIDRLDLDADGGYRLIDYKTGEALKSLLEPKKDDLQLNIYAMALAQHAGGGPGSAPPPGRAEYWVLSQGRAGVIDLAALDLEKTRATVLKVVEGMLTPPYQRGRECKGHCDLMG